MSENATNAAPATPASATPAAQAAPTGAPAALEIGAAPAAPAAAPAAPAADVTVAYEQTGDPGLDMALGFVGKLGVGPDDPAMKAASDGDFSLIKAKLASLGDKALGWEQYVSLAERSFTEGKSKSDAKLKADTEVIHQAVGGEAQWNAIKEWAGKNAEPAEKEAVNTALKQGGLLAKITATWLAGQYSKAAGTVVEPASVLAPGANGRADVAGPLTAKDYATQVQQLRTKLGFNMENSQEYKALQARRMQSRNAGK